MAREPKEAPALPGFDFVSRIGSGGFADVFLYRDELLGERLVAVKVLDLTAIADGSALEKFQREADLMIWDGGWPVQTDPSRTGRCKMSA